MNKKVFVTGGAGYIGSHVCLELLRENYEVMVFDDLSNSSEESVRRVELLANSKLELVVGDIRNQAALSDAIVSFKPDTVMHFAGLKAVAHSVSDPLLYYDVNVLGSINLLKAMAKISCGEFIFSSSATVYGEVSTPPYKEIDPVSPVSPYGRSKLIVENILSDWVEACASNKAVVLRYFNPVGAHESGLLGEDPRDTPNNLMPLIAQTAQKHRRYLSIFGSDYETRDGTGERDYIHVCDLAHGHLKAVEKISDLLKFQILNLGTGNSVTVMELINIFQASNNVPIPTRLAARRPGDAAKSFADPSLANDLIGFKCQKTVEQMCIDTWNWVQKNPNGYQ